MKCMFFKSSLVWAGILLSVVCYGQSSDVPLGALPMQYNSSFAGEGDGPRISSNTRLGFPSKSQVFMGTLYKSGWYSNTNISFDQFFSAIRSGVGISVNYGSASGEPWSYKGAGFGVAIAPKFSLKGKYTLSPSIDFSYNSGRNVNSNWGDTNQTQIITGTNLTSRVGFLFNTQKWYIGYSVDLFTYSNLRYRIETPGLIWAYKPRFSSYWQVGYTFQRNSESKFSFTPQLVFRTGDDYPDVFHYFRFEAINLTFRYQKVIWGINNTGFHVGFQNKQMRVFLTSQFSRSIASISPYTGNLSFRYTFKKDK